MISSLAATLATLPSVTRFKYTIGVRPAGQSHLSGFAFAINGGCVPDCKVKLWQRKQHGMVYARYHAHRPSLSLHSREVHDLLKDRRCFAMHSNLTMAGSNEPALNGCMSRIDQLCHILLLETSNARIAHAVPPPCAHRCPLQNPQGSYQCDAAAAVAAALQGLKTLWLCWSISDFTFKRSWMPMQGSLQSAGFTSSLRALRRSASTITCSIE